MTAQLISRSIVCALMQWFEAWRRDLPWRGQQDPYRIWISEIMLQQTQVATAKPFYARWMDRFPNIQTLSESTLDDVMRLWEGLGYYSRARNCHDAARYIQKQYHGAFPRTMSDLLKIPGIGPYIAAAVGSIAFNLPVGVCDGNVARVISRLFALDFPTDAASAKKRIAKTVESGFYEFEPRWINQAWMDFGALQCTPRPQCPTCPFLKTCRAFQTESVCRYPIKVPKKPLPLKKGYIFLIIRDESVLMVKRPVMGLLANLWEIPNILLDSDDPLSFIVRHRIKILEKLKIVTHQYSHFKVEFQILKAQMEAELNLQNEIWVDSVWQKFQDLKLLPKSGVHIKALKSAHIME